jgi:hypothetical protein
MSLNGIRMLSMTSLQRHTFEDDYRNMEILNAYEVIPVKEA